MTTSEPSERLDQSRPHGVPSAAKWVAVFAVLLAALLIAERVAQLPWKLKLIVARLSSVSIHNPIPLVTFATLMAVGALLCLQRRGRGPLLLAWGALGVVGVRAVTLGLYVGALFARDASRRDDSPPTAIAWRAFKMEFGEMALPLAVALIAFPRSNRTFLAGGPHG